MYDTVSPPPAHPTQREIEEFERLAEAVRSIARTLLNFNGAERLRIIEQAQKLLS
jgi:hypothetical protein